MFQQQTTGTRARERERERIFLRPWWYRKANNKNNIHFYRERERWVERSRCSLYCPENGSDCNCDATATNLTLSLFISGRYRSSTAWFCTVSIQHDRSGMDLFVHEDNRAPYRSDTPPIRHRLHFARIGYAKTIRHRLDCARIGYAQTPGHRLDCAPLQPCTVGQLARLTPSVRHECVRVCLPRVSEWSANNENWNLVLIEIL